jgi:riboflavin kinase/FMN adenylyltransferase
MEVIHGCRSLSDGKKHFIALGTFDGVHIGHEKIIRTMVCDARASGGKSLVVTFSNHPRNFLKPQRPIKLLTSPEEKKRLIGRLDVDVLALLEFNRSLADMDSISFVRDILVSCFQVSQVYIGYNYSFGYKGNGSPELLEELGYRYGFKVQVMPPVCLNDDPVSSSSIRKLLASGEIELDPNTLAVGRNFRVR